MSASPASSTRATDAASGRSPKAGIVRLLRSGDFRRLLGTRFAAQFGDGMFQAALGGAVLFNPERQADPLAVAAGFAVLLLPYSLIGPFAGALLDRWDRRRVLLVANLLRAALVALVALLLGTGVGGTPLFLAALAVAGTSRFVLAGLSASLPHVVAPRHLVEANTVAATAGSALAALGAAAAIGLRELLGTGNAGSALVTAIAVVGSLIAAAVAAGFTRGVLGPDAPTPATAEGPDAVPAGTGSALRSVAHGMADGAHAVARTPTVAASFAALGAHRLAFGVGTLVSLLLFRSSTTGGPLPGGMAGVGEALGLAALGIGIGALLTPWLVHHLGRANAVRIALGVSVLTQIGLAVALGLPAVLASALLLGMTGQMIKLCTDTAVQTETGDGVRGRVFALYDALFNICYVIAVAAAALLSPPDGHAPLLVGAAAAVYLLGLLLHEQQLRRGAARTAAQAAS